MQELRAQLQRSSIAISCWILTSYAAIKLGKCGYVTSPTDRSLNVSRIFFTQAVAIAPMRVVPAVFAPQ